MKITRRKFITRTGYGIGLMSMNLWLAGCLFSQNVFDSILSYIGIGLQAFAAVVSLIPGISAAAPIVAIVNAGFTALQTAVTAYENAPASQKTTLLQKIVLALTDLQSSLAQFLQALSLPPALDTLIKALVAIIISTLAGFEKKIAPAGMVNTTHRGTMIGGITPVLRTPAQFKRDFNRALVAGGHAELVIK